MDFTATSMEYSDSISMEAMAWQLPWLPLNAMEGVEFYRIPRKPWNLIWLRIDLNCRENGR